MDETPIQAIIAQIDPPLSRTRVTQFYGGPASILCRLGFHHLWCIDTESDDRSHTEHVCLRCGRTLSIVESEWTGDDETGDDR